MSVAEQLATAAPDRRIAVPVPNRQRRSIPLNSTYLGVGFSGM